MMTPGARKRYLPAMSNGSEAKRIAIVGAGFSGLSAGTALKERGYEVRIFDKGRGAGGRAARRRAGELQFDHGAQYFTTRAPEFEKQVVAWRTAGIVAPWNPTLVVLENGKAEEKRSGPPRYVGTPGMNAPAKALASELEVSYTTKITAVASNRSGYVLTDEEEGNHTEFGAIVLAVTPEQADPLLPPGCSFSHDPAAVHLDPCWAVMVVFAEPLSTPGLAPPFDAAFVHGSALAWVARNGSKPDRPNGEAWVLHGSRDWSKNHIEEPPEAVGQSLLEALKEALGQELPEVVHLSAHRWRYAQARSALRVGSLWDSNTRVGLCGDWCNGSRVEGAYLSGLNLAENVCSAMDA